MIKLISLDCMVKSEDLFSGLNQEKEQIKSKKFEIEGSSLEKLIKAFEICLKSRESDRLVKAYTNQRNYHHLFYEICLSTVPLKYTAKDINNFIQFSIMQFAQDEFPYNLENKLGMFVSALINKSEEKEHEIFIPFVKSRTETYFSHMGYLGYENNGKHIIISGDGMAGEGIGILMKDGKIDINIITSFPGGSPSFGDSMRGGEINIHVTHGNDFIRIGEGMTGGRINVYSVGNRTQKVGRIGSGMMGGIINVKGNANKVGIHMACGEIHIEGENHGLVGYKMSGGIIYLTGNFIGAPGQEMKRGEIYITGKYFRLPTSAKGGNIYRNGNLIMRDGRKVR